MKIIREYNYLVGEWVSSCCTLWSGS